MCMQSTLTRKFHSVVSFVATVCPNDDDNDDIDDEEEDEGNDNDAMFASFRRFIVSLFV